VVGINEAEEILQEEKLRRLEANLERYHLRDN
jgi:hypothetical protein